MPQSRPHHPIVSLLLIGLGCFHWWLIATRAAASAPWVANAGFWEQTASVGGLTLSAASALGSAAIALGLAAWASGLATTATSWLRRPANGVKLGVAGILIGATLLPTHRVAASTFDLLLGSAGTVLVAVGLSGILSPIVAIVELATAAGAKLLRLPTRLLLSGLCAGVLALCVAFSWGVFGAVPHVVDAVCQLFQAKIFLTGQLSADAPPEGTAAAFDLTHMILDGTWYSQYPPGHPLLLAIGVLLRAPWLVNPIVGATTVLVLYGLAKELYDEATGRVAALLGASSYFLVLMSSTYMSHAPMHLFALLSLLGLARTVRRGGWRNAALCGFSVGCGATLRPLTAVAFALPIAFFLALHFGRSLGKSADRHARARCIRDGATTLVAALLPIAALLRYNALTNGDPLTFGFEVLHGREALPGFGHGGWLGTPHTLQQGLAHTLERLVALNHYLFCVPFPSLAPAAIGFVWLKRSRWDWLLVACIASLITAYATYWFSDLVLGPRFLFSASGPVIVLTARALVRLLRQDGNPLARSGAGGMTPRSCLAWGGLASIAFALLVRIPALTSDYSRNFFDGNADVARAARSSDLPDDAVVFVPPFHYPSVFALNDPRLGPGPVYVNDQGVQENTRVLQLLGNRTGFKLHSLDRYRVRPYPQPSEAQYDGVYDLPPGEGLEIEALTSQLGILSFTSIADTKVGAYGGGWRNDDHVEARPSSPEDELAFAFESAVARTCDATLVLSAGPEYGIVKVLLNQRELQTIDLFSERLEPRVYRLTGLRVPEGLNALRIRTSGKNPASEGFAFGVDSLRLQPQ